ncbi:phosphoglucosamine mutase [bacterium]|nr:phosphoglucosamine mutase [bacterium]
MLQQVPSLEGLTVSIAGFRGIVGEAMTPELAFHLAAVFAGFCPRGTVVVGRDSRPSGQALGAAVAAGLLSRGQNVLDIGIAPTPTVGFTVKKERAAGAVNLTASHNPSQWNALKLYGPDGSFLSPAMLERFLSLHELGAPPCLPSERFGHLREAPDAWKAHVERVLSQIKPEAIHPRHFRVVVDGCRGAGSLPLPFLLNFLGCEVIELDCVPDGRFTRPCEPLAENLTALRRRVSETRADLGMALDPDADRLALVDASGTAIGEEYTLALTTLAVFARGGRLAVANLSTSRLIDDVAARYGGRVIRTPIGEAHVVGAIRAHGAAIGGEGNGGVIWPAVHEGRDALAGAGLLLDYMAETGRTLAELVESLPRYHMVKHTAKVAPERVGELLSRARALHGSAQLNDEDGLKVIYPDRWVHVRASMTEPLVRIIAEAPTEADTTALCAPLLAEARRLS